MYINIKFLKQNQLILMEKYSLKWNDFHSNVSKSFNVCIVIQDWEWWENPEEVLEELEAKEGELKRIEGELEEIGNQLEKDEEEKLEQ